MRRGRNLFAVGGLALLAVGCIPTTSYTQLVPPPRNLVARPVDEVETLVLTPPSRPHKGIGFLQSNGAVDGAAGVQALRVRAAEIGCDAILITSLSPHFTGPEVGSLQATCVVYTDVPAVPTEPATEPAVKTDSATAETAPPVGPRAPRAPRWGVVLGTEAVQVRTAPTRLAPVIEDVLPGTRVSETATPQNGWLFVSLPNGRSGFVPEGAIRFE